MIRVPADPHERHVRLQLVRHHRYLFYPNPVRDHFVAKGGDERRDDSESVLSLVRDQNPEVLSGVRHS
jgi:hypothetical protein